MIRLQDPFGNITYSINIIEVSNNSTRHKSKNGETHSVKASENNITQEFNDGTKPEWTDTFEDLQKLNKEHPWLDPTRYFRDPPKPEDDNEGNFGYKENNGKVDYSEINLGILDLAAERFTANKHKYGKNNMKKPLDKNNLCWAMFRHVKKMLQPPKDDSENYKEHLAAVVCNASMILDQLNLEEK